MWDAHTLQASQEFRRPRVEIVEEPLHLRPHLRTNSNLILVQEK